MKDIFGWLADHYGWVIVAVLIVVLIWREIRRGDNAPGYRLRLTFFLNQFKIKGDNMALSMTSTQQASGQVQPLDSKGNPAQVQPGTVEYEVADSSLVEVVEDPDDETKFTVKALGPVGVTQLTVRADADLDETGVKTIETFAAIEITPAGAVGFGINFGAPEEQPATTE